MEQGGSVAFVVMPLRSVLTKVDSGISMRGAPNKVCSDIGRSVEHTPFSTVGPPSSRVHSEFVSCESCLLTCSAQVLVRTEPHIKKCSQPCVQPHIPLDRLVMSAIGERKGNMRCKI